MTDWYLFCAVHQSKVQTNWLEVVEIWQMHNAVSHNVLNGLSTNLLNMKMHFCWLVFVYIHNKDMCSLCQSLCTLIEIFIENNWLYLHSCFSLLCSSFVVVVVFLFFYISAQCICINVWSNLFNLKNFHFRVEDTDRGKREMTVRHKS